jgi:DNA-binding transcriptional LysR family regulator
MQNLTHQLPGYIAAVAAAEHGSFAAAARSLNLTPAAVGKNVAQLEARLGLRLFNRTTRSLAPTEEGLRVIDAARAGLASLQQAADVAQRSARRDAPLQGLVRISSAAGFGRSYLLPQLPALMSLHPRLSVELVLSDQTVDLVRDGFDIGVRGGQEPPQGMVARLLCQLPAVLVASPRYLASHGTPAHADDLSQHRLIGLRFLSGRVAPWQFRAGSRRVAVQPDAALWLSSPEAVLDAALLDMGIAQVGWHHAADALRSGAVQQVLKAQHVPGAVPLSLFYPHRVGLAPRVRAVVDHLWSALRADPRLAPKRG